MPIMSRFLRRLGREVHIIRIENWVKMSIQCCCNDVLRSLFAEAVRSVQPSTLIKNQVRLYQLS